MIARRYHVFFALMASGLFTASLGAQPAGIERPPKTPLELEREAERVRTRDLAKQRFDLSPLTTRWLRKVVERFEAGVPADKPLTARWAELLTADGNYFVPLQLGLDSTPKLVAGQKVTVFGVVSNGEGREVLSFEVERTLLASGSHLITDLPLRLDPGEYRGHFGLAAGREVLGLTSQSMNPRPIAKRELTVSRLFLAENLFMLAEPQAPDEPFAFGGIKVVLRGTSQFSVGEQPWVFLVLRQLGVGTEGQARLAARLVIEGPEGPASKRRTLPVADPAPTPLKGFAGQWALALPLDLARESPGRYEVTLEVEDLNLGEHRSAAASFEVMPR